MCSSSVVGGAAPAGNGVLDSVVLSRSDASQIRESIAAALGIDDHELACKLADAELARENDPEAIKQQTDRLMAAMGLIHK